MRTRTDKFRADQLRAARFALDHMRADLLAAKTPIVDVTVVNLLNARDWARAVSRERWDSIVTTGPYRTYVNIAMLVERATLKKLNMSIEEIAYLIHLADTVPDDELPLGDNDREFRDHWSVVRELLR